MDSLFMAIVTVPLSVRSFPSPFAPLFGHLYLSQENLSGFKRMRTWGSFVSLEPEKKKIKILPLQHFPMTQMEYNSRQWVSGCYIRGRLDLGGWIWNLPTITDISAGGREGWIDSGLYWVNSDPKIFNCSKNITEITKGNGISTRAPPNVTLHKESYAIPCSENVHSN